MFSLGAHFDWIKLQLVRALECFEKYQGALTVTECIALTTLADWELEKVVNEYRAFPREEGMTAWLATTYPQAYIDAQIQQQQILLPLHIQSQLPLENLTLQQLKNTISSLP